MGMSGKLLRPSGRFTPKSIANIVHWWDASDAGTLTMDTGVSQWRSKAGAQTVASQATGNNQPTTTTINGRTALLFDGANDGLTFTGAARTDETWILAAAQVSDQTGSRAILSDGGNGDGINAVKGTVKILDTSWGSSTDGVGRIRSEAAANPATPFPASIVSVVRSTAAGGFVYRNGTQQTSIVNGSTYFTTSGSVAIARIGFYSSATAQLNGWIGEIVCYSRALSAAERQKVERYMGLRWGITVA